VIKRPALYVFLVAALIATEASYTHASMRQSSPAPTCSLVAKAAKPRGWIAFSLTCSSRLIDYQLMYVTGKRTRDIEENPVLLNAGASDHLTCTPVGFRCSGELTGGATATTRLKINRRVCAAPRPVVKVEATLAERCTTLCTLPAYRVVSRAPRLAGC